MFIFEREQAWVGERQREGGREGGRQDLKLTPCCQCKANMGLELTNCEIMIWADIGRSTDWATQASQLLFLQINCLPFSLFSFWDRYMLWLFTWCWRDPLTYPHLIFFFSCSGWLCSIISFSDHWSILLHLLIPSNVFFIAVIFSISGRVFFNVLFIFERAQVGDGQRERDTEDLKQALHWEQWAHCGAWTHKPRDHDLNQSWCSANWATQVPW